MERNGPKLSKKYYMKNKRNNKYILLIADVIVTSCHYDAERKGGRLDLIVRERMTNNWFTLRMVVE
jgi:hypothetical protein